MRQPHRDQQTQCWGRIWGVPKTPWRGIQVGCWAALWPEAIWGWTEMGGVAAPLQWLGWFISTPRHFWEGWRRRGCGVRLKVKVQYYIFSPSQFTGVRCSCQTSSLIKGTKCNQCPLIPKEWFQFAAEQKIIQTNQSYPPVGTSRQHTLLLQSLPPEPLVAQVQTLYGPAWHAMFCSPRLWVHVTKKMLLFSSVQCLGSCIWPSP